MCVGVELEPKKVQQRLTVSDLLHRLYDISEQQESTSSIEMSKRGPSVCINSCLSGGQTFVRCKSMCH